MSYPYGQSLTLLSRTKTGVDGDGNDVFSSVSAALTNVPVWPRASSELVQGQDMVIIGYSALIPSGVTVKAVDQLVWNGATYEIDGEPGPLQSPFTGWNPGTQVALKRVTG